jgi:hypothetical protein
VSPHAGGEVIQAADILLDPADAGTVRYEERQTPSWRASLCLVLIYAVVYVASLAIVLRDPGLPTISPWVQAVIVWSGFAFFFTLVIVLASCQRVQVCDRAVVVRLEVGRARPYVIPLVSIDPASIRLHYHANFLGRRFPGTNGTRVVRMPPYSMVAVSLRGLRPKLAHPRLRTLQPDRHEIVSHFDYVNAPALDLAPFSDRWFIGTKRPERLLAALEEALVDAGSPGAAGVAQRELTAPRVEHFRRDPLDTEML